MLNSRYLYIYISLLTHGLFAQFEPDFKNDSLSEKSKITLKTWILRKKKIFHKFHRHSILTITRILNFQVLL